MFMKGCMKKFLSIVLVFSFLTTTVFSQFSFAYGAKSHTQDISGQIKRELREILVEYKDESRSEEIKKDVKNKTKLTKLDTKKKLKKSKLELLEIGSSDDIDSVIEEFQKDPNVLYAQANYKLYTSTIPSDSRFSEQWGLFNNGQAIQGQSGIQGIDINANKAWDISDGLGTIVGVIDTGIDINHEDLAPNIFINQNEIADNGIDDDNNGYIDDVSGWDFTNNDNNVYDSSSLDLHGTHVAGIIGACTNNQGITGVAPQVKIMPLKFVSGSSGYTSDAIEAIEYANTMGIKIVNCSWGSTDYNPALKDAMESSDILFVCAAGNYSSTAPFYPAAFNIANKISVAAINNKGYLSSFSNYGESVDIAAPGTDIISTVPENDYHFLSGTSMAAPYITGSAALLLAQNNVNSPHIIKERLEENTTTLPTLTGKIKTAGMVNTYKLLGGVEENTEEENETEIGNGNEENPEDTNEGQPVDNEPETDNDLQPIDPDKKLDLKEIPIFGIEGQKPDDIDEFLPEEEQQKPEPPEELPEIIDEKPAPEAVSQITPLTDEEIMEMISKKDDEELKVLNIEESLTEKEYLQIGILTNKNVKAQLKHSQLDKHGDEIDISMEPFCQEKENDFYAELNVQTICLNKKTVTVNYQFILTDEQGTEIETDIKNVNVTELNNENLIKKVKNKWLKNKKNQTSTNAVESDENDAVEVQRVGYYDTFETAKNITPTQLVSNGGGLAYYSCNYNTFLQVSESGVTTNIDDLDIDNLVDNDWYKFYVSEPSALNIDMNVYYNSRQKMYLYDSNKQLLGNSMSISSSLEKLEYNIQSKGYYYLKIVPYYTLDVFYLYDNGWFPDLDDSHGTFLEQYKYTLHSYSYGNYYLRLYNNVPFEDLDFNTFSYSSIDNDSDEDWYKITLSEKSKLNLKLLNIPTDCDYDLMIYNSSGTNVGGSYRRGNIYEEYNIVLDQDTYYIKIFSYQGCSSSQYTIWANKYKPDDYEVNESSTTAKNITCNQTISGSIDNLADLDWYKINIPEKSKVNFKLQNIPSGCDFDIKVYNSSLDYVGGSYRGSNYNEEFWKLLTPGDYYIKVYRYAGCSQYDYYDLTVNKYIPDSYELNENSSYAKPIEIGDTITASIDNAIDQDWYKISLLEDSKAVINLDDIPSDCSYNVNLYNSSLSWINGLYINGDSNKIVSYKLDAGDYYLRINSSSGYADDENYSLTVENCIPDEYELNEGYSTASQIDCDDTIMGTMDNQFDQDWYKINIEQTCKVNLKLENIPANCNYDIRVYNSSTYCVGVSCCGSNYNEEIWTLLTPGEYYVKVYSYTGSSQDEYVLTVNNYMPDAFELNENYQAAVPITLKNVIWATIDNIQDVDFYEFDISEMTKLNLTLQYIPGGCDYNLSLYNSSLSCIGNSTNDASNDENIISKLEPGRYYIKVESQAGFSSENTYCLFCETDYPVSFESAKLLFNNVEETGSLELMGEEHYYKINTAIAGECIIESTGNMDTYGELYDEEYNLIAANDNEEDDYNFKLKQSLAADKTYYVKLRHNSNSDTGSYGIKANIPTAEIESLNASIDSANNVNVNGIISSGAGKKVLISVYRPDDMLQSIEQITSGESGSFDYSFTIISHVPGVYQVIVSGEGVTTPGITTFNLGQAGCVQSTEAIQRGIINSDGCSMEILNSNQFVISSVENISTGKELVEVDAYFEDQNNNQITSLLPTIDLSAYATFENNGPKVSCHICCLTYDYQGNIICGIGSNETFLNGQELTTRFMVPIDNETYEARVFAFSGDFEIDSPKTPISNVVVITAEDDCGNAINQAEKIKMSEKLVNSINYYGDNDYFKFVPDYSGYFEFRSYGTMDTFGELYNSNGVLIASNDNFYNDNFSITSYLQAGQSYYINVKHPNNNEIGDYKVYVREADSDGDGITDDMEENGINISYNDRYIGHVTLDRNNPDTDGDGLDDGLELLYLRYKDNDMYNVLDNPVVVGKKGTVVCEEGIDPNYEQFYSDDIMESITLVNQYEEKLVDYINNLEGFLSAEFNNYNEQLSDYIFDIKKSLTSLEEIKNVYAELLLDTGDDSTILAFIGDNTNYFLNPDDYYVAVAAETAAGDISTQANPKTYWMVRGTRIHNEVTARFKATYGEALTENSGRPIKPSRKRPDLVYDNGAQAYIYELKPISYSKARSNCRFNYAYNQLQKYVELYKRIRPITSKGTQWPDPVNIIVPIGDPYNQTVWLRTFYEYEDHKGLIFYEDVRRKEKQPVYAPVVETVTDAAGNEYEVIAQDRDNGLVLVTLGGIIILGTLAADGITFGTSIADDPVTISAGIALIEKGIGYVN